MRPWSQRARGFLDGSCTSIVASGGSLCHSVGTTDTAASLDVVAGEIKRVPSSRLTTQTIFLRLFLSLLVVPLLELYSCNALLKCRGCKVCPSDTRYH